jgi:hypothetical protein
MSTTLSAFEPYANATLSVDLAVAPLEDTENTGWITDPRTGNLVPSPEPVGEVCSPVQRRIYKAHLHPSRLPQLNRAAGVNSTTFALEGLLLEPWQFDDLIQPNQIFDAVYNGLPGQYELLPEQSMLPEFKSILGTRLRGIFRMSGAGLTT